MSGESTRTRVTVGSSRISSVSSCDTIVPFGIFLPSPIVTSSARVRL